MESAEENFPLFQINDIKPSYNNESPLFQQNFRLPVATTAVSMKPIEILILLS
jgi:hypothetical protein